MRSITAVIYTKAAKMFTSIVSPASGRCSSDHKSDISEHIWRIKFFLTRLVKLLLDECHKTPFMTILVLTQISVEIWCRQATMNWFIYTSKCCWNLKYSCLFSDPCPYGKRFENCGAYHIEVYHVHIQKSFEHQNWAHCELRVRNAVKTLLDFQDDVSIRLSLCTAFIL